MSTWDMLNLVLNALHKLSHLSLQTCQRQIVFLAQPFLRASGVHIVEVVRTDLTTATVAGVSEIKVNNSCLGCLAEVKTDLGGHQQRRGSGLSVQSFSTDKNPVLSAPKIQAVPGGIAVREELCVLSKRTAPLNMTTTFST